MTTLENAQAKRAYITYLTQAKGSDHKTVEQFEAAIAKFDDFLCGQDYRCFNSDVACAFKDHLRSQISASTGRSLSTTMIVKILRNIQSFLKWLRTKKGNRSLLSETDIDYLNPSSAEKRLATMVREKQAPPLKTLCEVVKKMPCGTVLQRRDRAAIALSLVTGVRDHAQVTLMIRNFDPVERLLDQNPQTGVATKNRKHIKTWFFPVDPELDQIVIDWHSELIREHKFKPTDPLFPATQQRQDPDNCFAADGLSRSFWTTANVLRSIYCRTCEQAGLPFRKLHHIRDALSALGMQISRTPEMFKAWSQNMGHDSVLTTALTYGRVEDQRQRAIIKGLAGAATAGEDSLIVRGIRDAAAGMGYALVPIRTTGGSL